MFLFPAAEIGLIDLYYIRGLALSRTKENMVLRKTDV